MRLGANRFAGDSGVYYRPFIRAKPNHNVVMPLVYVLDGAGCRLGCRYVHLCWQLLRSVCFSHHPSTRAAFVMVIIEPVHVKRVGNGVSEDVCYAAHACYVLGAG